MGVWWTMLVAAAMLAVSTAIFVTYALLIRVISKWLMRHSTAVDAVTAAVFGVLGIVIMIRGIGAVLARKHIAQPYLQRYELVRLPGPALKARYAYYVVHADHRALSPTAQAFMDWLKREALDERTPLPALPDELLGLPPADPARD